MNDGQVRDLQARLRAIVAGQFEVGELLGAGAFAAVFRARDLVLGRDVAIKVLDPALALDPAAADRLLDEARLVASTEHPHIVPLYEAGNQDGIVFLVMRYFPDGTAGTRLAALGQWPPAQVAQLGIEVADALATAHARGVIHLDIKPDNILLDANGHAAVADFGIARVFAGAVPAEPSLVSGTPHYMSPEQVAGDQLDGRTDVYALGVVLYELATGQHPVGGNSAREVMANQVRQAPTPLQEVAPEMPAALSRVITRALAKDPAQRWGSAREMVNALRAASTPDQLVAPRVARKRTRRRWYGRGAMVGCGVVAGLLLIGYAVIWTYRAFNQGDPPAVDALGALIPAVLLDSARAAGTLTERDTAVYIFVPHGKGMNDALILTTRDIVAITSGRVKRYPIADNYRIDINRTPRQGLLLIRPPSREFTDTVYTGMTGLEQQVLGLSLRRAFASLSD
jgi:serine/threonine-protein kinase